MGTILGPYNKDCGILGSILGSPYFGKLPYICYGLGFRAYIYIYIYVYTCIYTDKCRGCSRVPLAQRYPSRQALNAKRTPAALSIL